MHRRSRGIARVAILGQSDEWRRRSRNGNVIGRWWEERARLRRMEESPRVFQAPSNEKGLQRRGIVHGELSKAIWTWYRTRTFVS
jgi:hypothetical protein